MAEASSAIPSFTRMTTELAVGGDAGSYAVHARGPRSVALVYQPHHVQCTSGALALTVIAEYRFVDDQPIRAVSGCEVRIGVDH